MKNKPASFTTNWARGFAGLGVTLILLGAGCSNGVKEVDKKENSAPTSNDKSSTSSALPTVPNRKNDDSLIDPNQDGWVTEALAEKAKKQLKLILSRVGETGKQPVLAGLVDETSRSQPLRHTLKTVFASSNLRVMRPAKETSLLEQESLIGALRNLVSPMLEIGTPKFHVKVVRVRLDEEAGKEKRDNNENVKFVTTCLYEGQVHNGQTALQQTAELDCHWLDRPEGLFLTHISASKFEEAHLNGNDGKLFVDCTETVIGDQPSFREQLAFGTNHWMEQIERAHGMDDTVPGAGLALGDANGDGLDDVYVCQGPGLPNRLFLQELDGTVTDYSTEAGVDWLDHTSAALFLDLDNDGDQDLAIATKGGLLVMENTGKAVFVKRAQLAKQMTDVQSLTSSDYDLDGDLDLFLCAYRHESGRLRGEFVFHDATTGGRNYLFRNDIGQDWRFTDVTHDVGLDADSTRYTLAAAWEDYDNDGDSDLYVANDYGPNFLFRNDNGKFSNQTSAAGLTDTGFGMSVSWGDYDRDGRMDLYIGNMFSSAGSRITRQAKFQANSDQQQRALYQRMAKGNSLFVNQPNNVFRDVSQQAQVEMGRWAWSSVFADINNDGWEDLLVANGYITTEDSGDL